MKGKFFDILTAIVLVVGIGMYAERNYINPPVASNARVSAYYEDWKELITQSTRPEAKLQVVVFSDYECPFCKDFHDNVLPLLQKREDIGISIIHYPIGSHAYARPAAKAAECARLQGKFWHLDSAIFADVPSLATDITTFAKVAKVPNIEKWTSCLTSKEADKVISEHLKLVAKYKIGGTPSFIINGWSVANGTIEMFEQNLKDILQEKKPFKR